MTSSLPKKRCRVLATMRGTEDGEREKKQLAEARVKGREKRYKEENGSSYTDIEELVAVTTTDERCRVDSSKMIP